MSELRAESSLLKSLIVKGLASASPGNKNDRVDFWDFPEYLVMGEAAGHGTSTLLLCRLVKFPQDGEAWRLFTQRYSGTIYAWCRRRHLQDADARDVTQDVFTALLRALPGFDRKRGRVRNWLFRFVENGIKDLCKTPAQRVEKGTTSVRQALESAEARRDLEARLVEEFDLELLGVAEQYVRLKVAPHCWESYCLRCKERLTLRQAAERVGIRAGHVSKYALRVRDLVARQIALLEAGSNVEIARGLEGQNEHLSTSGEME